MNSGALAASPRAAVRGRAPGGTRLLIRKDHKPRPWPARCGAKCAPTRVKAGQGCRQELGYWDPPGRAPGPPTKRQIHHAQRDLHLPLRGRPSRRPQVDAVTPAQNTKRVRFSPARKSAFARDSTGARKPNSHRERRRSPLVAGQRCSVGARPMTIPAEVRQLGTPCATRATAISDREVGLPRLSALHPAFCAMTVQDTTRPCMNRMRSHRP